jgi:hypothetical protein
MPATFDNLEENPRMAEIQKDRSVWMGVLWTMMDVEGMSPESPFSASAPVKLAVRLSTAVALAVAVVDELVPYSAEPILGWHLLSFHHPYQQRPWESYTEESLQLKTFEAFLALSSSALTLVILVAFSLLLASVCLLQPWPGASFS